jgi:LuxR family maltose regulon positive regulatory protein
MERLRGVLSYSLILVSAPAGFGKTTLVSDWTRQNQVRTPSGWLSLDDGDNDRVRFWDYFIAALRTLQPATGETALTLLHSPQPYSTEAMLTTLINDLTDTPPI